MSQGKLFIISGLITLGYVDFIVAWRPFRIEKYNVTAQSLSENVDINITLTDNESASIYVNMKKNLQQPFAEVKFYMDSGNGLFDLQLVNETVDVCRFLRDKKYLPVIQMSYKSYVERGNFPTACPIKKNLYVGENMKVDVERLPPTMPDRQMYLAITLFSKEGANIKPLLFYKIFVKIVKI